MRYLPFSLLIAALLLQAGTDHCAWAGVSPQTEMKMLSDEARGGRPEAELLYGLALLEGKWGTKPDLEEGYRWIRRSAHEGDTYAQSVLGNLYAEGRGTEARPDRAVYWWLQAAKGDNRDAQYRLGKAYLEGKMVGRDDVSAVYWLTKSAQQGDSDAEYLIGQMYLKGDAVAQDRLLAQDWLDKAARQGHSEAINLLRSLAEVVDVTTMVRSQSTEELEARAKKGDPQAEYELAMRYETGAFNVDRDDAKALQWLLTAARHGNLLAMRTLVHVYNQGELGIDPDPKQGAYWAQRVREGEKR